MTLNIQKPLKDFRLILRLQTRQEWYHRAAALSTLIAWSLRMGLTILLYHGIYDIIGKADIKGINFQTAAGSMVFYAIYSGFNSRGIFHTINTEFKSGAIELWLNKPISYILLKIGENLGKNIPTACALILCAVLFWSLNGLPPVDHLLLRFLAGTVLLILGVIVGYLLYSLIGLSAVWLQDATGVFMIADKIIMVFGGAYIPIAFFPHYFRLIGESLPTGAVTFLSQTFYPDFFDNLPRFIVTQLAWVLALGFALYQGSNAVNKHMTVNGG